MIERPRYFVLDEAGEPRPEADVIAFAEWFEHSGRDRVIQQDYVEGEEGASGAAGRGPIGVSTVFLGINHQYGEGPPVLWESLVSGTALDGEMRRYTSREAALRGHRELVEAVSAAWRAARAAEEA